jgi:hypothetical protein
MAAAATYNPTLPVNEMITAPVIIPMSTLVPAAFSLPSIGFLKSHASYHVFRRGRGRPLSRRERVVVREKMFADPSQNYFFLPFFFFRPPPRDRFAVSRACLDCARLASLEIALPRDESRIDWASEITESETC